jgi:hypothetical protein
MVDPDIEFHRFLSRDHLTKEEYERHPAKLDLDKIDPKLAVHLAAIKKLINEMFARNSDQIDTPKGVTLHLDYIAKPLPPLIRFANAISFTFKGFFFVGVTYDLVELMNAICGSLAQSPATAAFLGIKTDTPAQREILLACLFLVQIQFAIDHEVGHHFHGHTGRSESGLFSSEYLCSTAIQDRDQMEEQAREVEADGYAVHMMAKSLFQPETGANLIARLGPTTLSTNEFLVHFLLLCIASYLILRPQNSFNPGDARKPRHPFGTMRLNVVMTDFLGWASQFKPELMPFITQITLDHVQLAIQGAQANSQSYSNWTLEGQFLRTTEGETYRADLYRFREALRKQMEGRAWGLRSDESGSSPSEEEGTTARLPNRRRSSGT